MTISLSNSAAEGIGKALDQDVYGVETAERMAWLVLLLKKCEDRPEWFPRGKWATIQHIESQLNEAIDSWVSERFASDAAGDEK
ncbi:MAG: hypothetical protein RB191_19915 [Terriglobia bacterium]|nr:hypothetical protein [Terriglobia bacterium]